MPQLGFIWVVLPPQLSQNRKQQFLFNYTAVSGSKMGIYTKGISTCPKSWGNTWSSFTNRNTLWPGQIWAHECQGAWKSHWKQINITTFLSCSPSMDIFLLSVSLSWKASGTRQDLARCPQERPLWNLPLILSTTASQLINQDKSRHSGRSIFPTSLGEDGNLG